MLKFKENIYGVIVPIITPIDEKERVDEAAYRAVIRRCISFGVGGIFAGGSAGMGPLLTEKQWIRAMEVAYDEVGESCILMGGIITASTAIAIERIKILERIGYKKMVVTPTFYIKLERDSEMLCHFGTCRDATDMEMVIYNIPSCTGSSISVSSIQEMGLRSWSKLIKESSGDREYFTQLIKISNDLGMAVLQGNEPDIEWGLEIGAAGIVPVCANYEPLTFVRACEAAIKGETEILANAQERISAIREILLRGDKNWISGIMYGVHTLGIGTGKPMLPLQELTPATKKAIDKLKPMDICAEVRANL